MVSPRTILNLDRKKPEHKNGGFKQPWPGCFGLWSLVTFECALCLALTLKMIASNTFLVRGGTTCGSEEMGVTLGDL